MERRRGWVLGVSPVCFKPTTKILPGLTSPTPRNVQLQKGDERLDSGQASAAGQSPDGEKIGRNDPCWCGSGKKYKRCHGAA